MSFNPNSNPTGNTNGNNTTSSGSNSPANIQVKREFSAAVDEQDWKRAKLNTANSVTPTGDGGNSINNNININSISNSPGISGTASSANNTPVAGNTNINNTNTINSNNINNNTNNNDASAINANTNNANTNNANTNNANTNNTIASRSVSTPAGQTPQMNSKSPVKASSGSVGIVLPPASKAAVKAEPKDEKVKGNDNKEKISKDKEKGKDKDKFDKKSGGSSKKEKDDGAPLSPADPDKMADALYGTGVELKEEEALLHKQSEKHRNKLLGTGGGSGSGGGSGNTGSGSGGAGGTGGSGNQAKDGSSDKNKRVETPMAPLIVRSQVFGYAKQQANAHGLKIPQGQEKEFADFLSVACEEMLSPILNDMVMYSRHRRRTIKSSNSTRSEISKALRDQAVKQKELEEKRLNKKIQLGIEVADGKNKPKAEELSHRAANATAAMMTSGRTKTYSWMTGGGGAGGGGSSSLGSGFSSSMSGSSSLSGSRGSDKDSKGVRYREARQEEVFSVRDFVKALENRRRGADKTLVKSYAKLKDMYR